MQDVILIAMTYIATVTSRGQLTIPAELFRKTSLKKGGKGSLSVDGNHIKMQSALELVNRLAGSVKLPDHLQGKSIEEIIEESKRTYFRRKGSMT